MLTGRQQAIFDFILRFRRQNGCSPSIPEIQRAFAIRSPNGVAGHIRALVRKGVLRRANRGSRQLDPVGEDSAVSVLSLPVYGQIAAGMPDLSSSLGLATSTFMTAVCRPRNSFWSANSASRFSWSRTFSPGRMKRP